MISCVFLAIGSYCHGVTLVLECRNCPRSALLPEHQLQERLAERNYAQETLSRGIAQGDEQYKQPESPAKQALHAICCLAAVGR